MTDIFPAFFPPKFICKKCAFVCSKKIDWVRHNSTLKHKNNTSYLQKTPHCYACNLCVKKYKHRQSLFTHCKKCHELEIDDDDDTVAAMVDTEKNENNSNDSRPNKQGTSVSNEIVLRLIEQNTELQKQILELSRHPVVVNNTQNITNNQFNMNFFLHETCKDALNIDDFMNSLHLTVEDLEETGRVGFVQGITRIFLQGLRDLDITQRPFHCTDVKRETVYVKDQDKWEKETTEKTRMKQALNQAVRKNLGVLPEWRKDHPDYLRSNTKDNDEYIKISLNSLGSQYDDEQKRMDEKIIRNILKEVILDKKGCLE